MKQSARPTSRANPLRLRTAVLADVEALARLINSAFRVEQPFIEGDRINPDGVHAYLGKGKFLLAEDAAGLTGCVYVDLRVVSARTPLPSFYGHLGYLETGTAPFSPDVPAKIPCHYILMSKILA